MKKNLHIIALFVFGLISSCVQKTDRTLAIGVLLTVPDEIYQQSIQLNHEILKNTPDNITLNAQHIPHITLLQCYVNENNLSKIEKELEGLYKWIEQHSLLADELQYTKDKSESFASIGIERSEALMTLHKKTIKLLKPYILTEGTQEAYVQNPNGTPIDVFTLAYVPKFVNDHSYENYNPHISLGVASTSLLDSLAQHQFRDMKFQAKTIGIYQLGAFGTAQKRIWESE